MPDHPETLSRYRLPWRSDRMHHTDSAGRLQAMSRNPFFLLGAVAVGVAGVLAWRNRERIAQKTAPLIEDARLRGQELIEDAKVMGQELIDEAKARTQEVARKASRVRRRIAHEST